MPKKNSRFPTELEIRQRPRNFSRARDGRGGREIEDWLEAESELRQLPAPQLAKLTAPKFKRT